MRPIRSFYMQYSLVFRSFYVITVVIIRASIITPRTNNLISYAKWQREIAISKKIRNFVCINLSITWHYQST